MRDLLAKVARVRPGETVIEHTPAGDSRANGRAERAVQAIEKQVRVLKIATENVFGQKIRVGSPAFAWLILHAADILTKYQVMTDGRTSYERIKGRKYSG